MYSASGTVRLMIVNTATAERRRDEIGRFLQAYRETLDWMYSDPAALKAYAEWVNISESLAREGASITDAAKASSRADARESITNNFLWPVAGLIARLLLMLRWLVTPVGASELIFVNPACL